MNYVQLNDFICACIQINGIEYVVTNYIALREAYFEQKSKLGG